ncbi:MAG TPA: amino acid adenylation domain-containing protein [Anaerolineales bacterium]|nr:amino acid adenylation domain-containing protein [Anaerolineales bacterium]
MNNQMTLPKLLVLSAHKHPNRIAVEETDGSVITYQDLNQISDRLNDRLIQLGICPGDRVGIYLRKSVDAVASIFGILKAGAIYVPVDPGAPPSRNAYIFNDCSVKAILVENRFVERLSIELASHNISPTLIVLDGTGGGDHLKNALERVEMADPAFPASLSPSTDDLAYILYTSGSTGKPKGVMLSHKNALSFIDWCSEVFEPSEIDRFSSHAPFHFDLSILDLYVSLKHGATLVLIEEEIGKDPIRLASLISEKRISIWYSTPSILSFLAQYGRLDRYEFSDLRLVLFAGEVFPIKHLRMLKDMLPRPRYFNLYGPTETNVCTYYEIPTTFPVDQTKPFPIGKACSHYNHLIKIVDEQGQEVGLGQMGELIAAGPGVMQGYWNLPEKTANAFLVDSSGQRWYKTGDVVVLDEDGNYIYLSRRDRMVKKRGYRVELGEIEAGLYNHPDIKEAAVIALSNDENGVQIKAYLSFKDGQSPSRIALKRFCAENLPNYMIPDFFTYLDSLPKTSTDKIDYQKLKTIE